MCFYFDLKILTENDDRMNILLRLTLLFIQNWQKILYINKLTIRILSRKAKK
jgi:hypothetical protein